MFGGETGANIASVGLLSKPKHVLLLLGLMSQVYLLVLRAVGAVHDLFYLMFNLLFGY